MWDEEYIFEHQKKIDRKYLDKIHICGSNPIVLIEGIHPKRDITKIKKNIKNSIFF